MTEQVPSDESPFVRFVQVAVSGVNNTQNTQSDYVIAALDEQGRVWEYVANKWYCILSPSMVIP